jgi:hypothetical protein
MLEVIFVAYLLALFIVPLPVLGGTSFFSAGWFFYKKYYLFKNQPVGGKIVCYLTGASGVINVGLSFLLSIAISKTIDFLLFKFVYLYYFNLIFAFSVSARWFDFSHSIYKYYIDRALSNFNKEGKKTYFVSISGYRKGAPFGFGAGLLQTFVDSGYLIIDEHEIQFTGVFIKGKIKLPANYEPRKLSSEKIEIAFPNLFPNFQAEKVIIAMKEQFYPFKSREDRNFIHQTFIDRAKFEPVAK